MLSHKLAPQGAFPVKLYTDLRSPMLYTVEPRNKEPLCNKVLGITSSFAYHSNSEIYGKEPR